MLEYKRVSMYGSSDYCRGWNDAVKEMPKWISVKERMPESEQKVLVYAVGYAFGFEGDTVMAITCQSMHRDGSMYWHSPWQYFQSDYKITHWMPLPDAPEVDDE